MAAKPPQVSVSCPSDTRWWLSDRPRHPFGSLTYKLVSYQRRKVAAALSAAVTTTKPIGDAPNSQAEPTMQKQPTQTPAALRGGSAREGLLSVASRPPPRITQSHLLFGRGGLGERRFSQRSGLSPSVRTRTVSSGGSAREGASLQRSTLPRISFLLSLYIFR